MAKKTRSLSEIRRDGATDMGKVPYGEYQVVVLDHNLDLFKMSYTDYDVALSAYDAVTQTSCAFAGLRDDNGWMCRK